MKAIWSIFFRNRMTLYPRCFFYNLLSRHYNQAHFQSNISPSITLSEVWANLVKLRASLWKRKSLPGLSEDFPPQHIENFTMFYMRVTNLSFKQSWVFLLVITFPTTKLKKYITFPFQNRFRILQTWRGFLIIKGFPLSTHFFRLSIKRKFFIGWRKIFFFGGIEALLV